ncbi:class I SAM-dependent DNA methyltransferase [Aequorivita lipolytica]|uniref:Class I SAM-dependent methyltransferase n=1 Tax=Aequorivita lipolytica TaxID=153267 RepID=A0A5C6YLH8_9FLAO|nr:class I SAM-dependent methyltransferase [Aequorivita lipolytica]TXD67844.1 class I SAM-dependent methyltransferase [Aequorivita lipolytica]SRX54010.1 Trans-aconitate 2-methyltransferase [Aequorivita lipolytica]
MDKYQETFQTWNKIAEIYQDKFMNLDLYNDSYDVFLDTILKTNSSIFEIGCGPGNITKYLLSKKNVLKIEGIDISENMIELAKKNNPMAKFQIMDCRQIGSLNKKFDAIICGFCIPYLSKNDCKKLISDCKYLLNDNGILYLSFVDGNYGNSGYITGSNGDRTYFYYHNLNNLEKTLKSNDFEINNLILKNYKKIDGTDEIHTILISKKTNAQHSI